MAKKKVFLGLILTFIGLLGIASLLTMEVSLPEEVEAILMESFSAGQIKIITLINPLIMMLIAVLVGTLLYDKAGLKVPLIEKLIGLNNFDISAVSIVKYGIIGGVASGLFITLIAQLFNLFIPAEFNELSESVKPTLAARFFYGGFTEEIMMRFGLMTFFVWALMKLFKSTKPVFYWSAIILAALIFAVGHFPVAFQTVDIPSPSLISYILLGNTTGGVIFGWLYWKKGLESAFLAHIVAHVVMVLAAMLMS